MQTWLGIFSSTFIKPVVCGVPPSKQKALVITLQHCICTVFKPSLILTEEKKFMKKLQSNCFYSKGKKNYIMIDSRIGKR